MEIMAGVSLASTLIGGGLSAASASSQGKSQSAMYGYQSQISRINEQIAKDNASHAFVEGSIQRQQYGQKSAAQQAAIVTAQSGSGLDINSGTAAAVQDSQRQIGLMDQNQISANTGRKAQGYLIDAAKSGAQAANYDAASANARKAGNLGVMSSIIGTAGSVADKWMYASKLGMLGSGSAGSSRYIDVGSATQMYNL